MEVEGVVPLQLQMAAAVEEPVPPDSVSPAPAETPACLAAVAVEVSPQMGLAVMEAVEDQSATMLAFKPAAVAPGQRAARSTAVAASL